jgi:iron complex transport system substrate-binding protein
MTLKQSPSQPNMKREHALNGAGVLLATMLACLAAFAHATISVRDDSGNTVTLEKPAQRVISFAPHVTDLLFAAGGASHVVGVIAYSDFPEAAKHLPQVGDSREIDFERVVALKPDLLVVWQSGNTSRQLEQLRRLGVPMFFSEPHKLEDIPSNVERLGELMGSDAAHGVATDFRKQLAELGARYRNRAPVRVFYQVSDKPLYTLNGQHIVSDALALCGGRNIFANLRVVAPAVSVEAVLQQDPEAIVSGSGRARDNFALWRQFPAMRAVRRGNLLSVDGALMNRPGPRMLQGAASLCEQLDKVRQQRGRPTK